MPEALRVVVFTSITMEDGDWVLTNANPPDEVITYQATGGEDGSSLTIARDGTTVFDLDFKAGQEIKVVGNVVHLPEGAFPGADEPKNPSRG